MQTRILTLSALALAAQAAGAQTTAFVYRLGKDTVAVEQYTRSGNRVTGDVLNRQGAAVTRIAYDATYGGDGRISSVTYKIMGADSKPIAGRPTEIRYVVKGDSATRTIVWADSTPVRTFAVTNPVPYIGPGYGMLEPAFVMMRRNKMTNATLTILGGGVGATLPTLAFTAAAGDTLRQPSGMVVLVGSDGTLRSIDGTATTGKFISTRSAGGIDIGALASRMTPTGALSSRGTARASFQTQQPGGVMMIDYGRPQVRDRSVWGGVLIPVDSVWRLGANEATHFATGRDLDFNGTAVPAGLYSLFLLNARTGPILIVNKQVGQWGTVYDAARDLVRIPLTMAATKEHVEEFTISIRQAAANRGALEFAWGNQMATASFVVK